MFRIKVVFRYFCCLDNCFSLALQELENFKKNVGESISAAVCVFLSLQCLPRLPVAVVAISWGCVCVSRWILFEAPETWLNFNYCVDKQCLTNTHSSGPVTRDTVKVTCWLQYDALTLVWELQHVVSLCALYLPTLSGGSCGGTLVLEERSDCGSVVASLFLPPLTGND